MLQGQIALVTGASRGIGQAIALALGNAGATVIGTATSEQGARAIGEYLAAANIGGRGMKLDVCDAGEVDAVVATIEKDFGAVNVLVNNAGITRDNLLMRMKDEEWDAIMATNLTSVFRLSRAVLRAMMKARGGRIISIASVVGAMGNAGHHGLHQVARARGRQPQHHGELRCAGFHRHRYDARIAGGPASSAAGAHPARPAGLRGGHCAGRAVPGIARGGLCFGHDAACQWRHVHGVTVRESLVKSRGLIFPGFNSIEAFFLERSSNG